jgi:hypothetical protein
VNPFAITLSERKDHVVQHAQIPTGSVLGGGKVGQMTLSEEAIMWLIDFHEFEIRYTKFILLEKTRMVGRGKVSQSQTKFFKPISMNCFLS